MKDEECRRAARYLSGWTKPGSKEERRGMKLVEDALHRIGNWLDHDGPDADPIEDGDIDVLRILALAFDEDRISIKKDTEITRDQWIAQFCEKQRRARGDFEAAVKAATKEFGISRATVTRALKKHPEWYRRKRRTQSQS
jgi:hypothetical protein